ncbi:hypothetical protein ACFRFH_11985 [Leifsonia sp. NPDC056824]|uniref:hypothetical protein n=1 Tax=Leifsonia sp. NPDC056824 TaxID=3345953 RepID=UPI0036920B8A
MAAELEPWLLSVLRDVGLDHPDPDVPLHVKLVNTLHRLGPAATHGQRVVAMRWDFNWELEEAGRVFAKKKALYEKAFAKRKVRELAEPKMSVAKAEAIAEADDEIFSLKLEYLLAEQRERAMRKFLDTLDAALDNHRTDRADQRAGDRAHAGGWDGAA